MLEPILPVNEDGAVKHRKTERSGADRPAECAQGMDNGPVRHCPQQVRAKAASHALGVIRYTAVYQNHERSASSRKDLGGAIFPIVGPRGRSFLRAGPKCGYGARMAFWTASR